MRRGKVSCSRRACDKKDEVSIAELDKRAESRGLTSQPITPRHVALIEILLLNLNHRLRVNTCTSPYPLLLMSISYATMVRQVRSDEREGCGGLSFKGLAGSTIDP